ncbi:MAG: hypothetical protein JXA13_17430 [Anaerolineales bacterium]|nr:hypothetical protein [Anaerolineales bacterium]
MTFVYKPVVPAASGPYRGAALVGTHSAMIGWTFDDPALREGLLGFAIRRSDLDPHTGEVLRLDWLGGYKRFKETDDGRAGDVRSLEAPFQRFRWSDYTLKAERAYSYEVYPVRGSPTALTRAEPPLIFKFRPSPEDPGDLGIYANRGVASAMAYLDRFGSQHPSEVGEEAYRWLSRGLKESLLELIAAAQPGEALHVAIYEFYDHDIARALKQALDRRVDVRIVHDAVPGKKTAEENEQVITHFGLEPVRVKRTTVNISHNKFVVHLVNGVPVRVWTGSANFSENAFNFQTNLALVLRDADTVQHYEAYFQVLAGNPSKADSKLANRAIMQRANALPDRFADKVFYSPVSGKDILDAAVELVRAARSAVLISAPFGLDKTVIDALLGNPKGIIEYGLVNSAARRKISKLQRENTRFFPPNRLQTYLGRSWDAKAFGAHKIHAKTIVVDPWSDSPRVLVGSANFSKPSCSDNDENALLVSGDQRLAAVITAEFMRMYDHYKTRFYIDRFNEGNRQIEKENRQRAAQGLAARPLNTMDIYLDTGQEWSRTAFDPQSSSHKFRDREVFSGG